MTYEDGHARILRQALSGAPDITEKKMLGGLCFLKTATWWVAFAKAAIWHK